MIITDEKYGIQVMFTRYWIASIAYYCLLLDSYLLSYMDKNS